jgi:hypothetical protein
MKKTINTDTNRLYAFIVLCKNNCILPEIAIENANIIKILTNDKDIPYVNLIEQILINEF